MEKIERRYIRIYLKSILNIKMSTNEKNIKQKFESLFSEFKICIPGISSMTNRIEFNEGDETYLYDLIFRRLSNIKESYGIVIYGLTRLIKYRKINNQGKIKKIWSLETSKYPITYLLNDYTKPLESNKEGRDLFYTINHLNARSDLEKKLSEKNYDVSGNRSRILEDLFEPIKLELRKRYDKDIKR